MNIQKTEINQITTEIIFLKHQTAQNIIEIGRRLLKAKEMLPHGEWGKWLDEKVDFTDRTARNFMRVARECSNWKAISDLPPTKVFALLDLPQDQREEFIENNQVEEMTTRELQKAIKEKKDLENRLRQLESRPPQVEIVEKEVIKQVIPSDYQDLQNKIKEYERTDKYWRDEYSKKVSEIQTIKEELSQVKQEDAKEQYDKKLKDSALMFCTKVNKFIQEVGGLAWVSDYINDLPQFEKQSYIKAINMVEGWATTIKLNMNKGD